MEKNKRIWTVPNLLSAFRILLVPTIARLYLVWQDYRLTAIVFLVSAATDVVDGFIARHFDAVSDLGKALDPIADKATQIVLLFCLLRRFEHMLLPFLLLLVKECFVGITSLIAIHRTKEVNGADWHGKAATVVLSAMMVLHLLWIDIPPVVSDISIGLSILAITLSLILYSIRNFRFIQRAKQTV